MKRGGFAQASLFLFFILSDKNKPYLLNFLNKYGLSFNTIIYIVRIILIGWGTVIRTQEMIGSEPIALPLGDTPITSNIIY